MIFGGQTKKGRQCTWQLGDFDRYGARSPRLSCSSGISSVMGRALEKSPIHRSTVVEAHAPEVRVTPDSGHCADMPGGPGRANDGLMRCSKRCAACGLWGQACNNSRLSLQQKSDLSMLQTVPQARGLNLPFGGARLAERRLVRAVRKRMRRCEDPSGSRPAGLAFTVARRMPA